MKKNQNFTEAIWKRSQIIITLIRKKIVLFGANVNPLGLSGQVKKDLAEHLDIISSYPDRDYTDLKKSNSCIYQYLAGTYCCRKWFYGAYLTSDQPARTKKERCFWDRPIPNMQES